jgi:putative FmdB family regulatory protein
MPLYEYRCRSCGARFELLQKPGEAPPAKCPACGGPVAKIISSPAIQFKGNGWYVTDYARKKAPAEGPQPEAKKDEPAKPEAGEATKAPKKPPADPAD